MTHIPDFRTPLYTAARSAALTILLLGLLPAAASQAVLAQEPVAVEQSAQVNINTADAETLASGLSGVGLSRAEEIIRYRQAYGPFATVDELVEVKGIGQATLDNNRSRITLE